MNHPVYKDAPGFQERSPQPIEDIPTDTEEFLRWGTTLDPITHTSTSCPTGRSAAR